MHQVRTKIVEYHVTARTVVSVGLVLDLEQEVVVANEAPGSDKNRSC